jgi:hypothetical protein
MLRVRAAHGDFVVNVASVSVLPCTVFMVELVTVKLHTLHGLHRRSCGQPGGA